MDIVVKLKRRSLRKCCFIFFNLTSISYRRWQMFRYENHILSLSIFKICLHNDISAKIGLAIRSFFHISTRYHMHYFYFDYMRNDSRFSKSKLIERPTYVYIIRFSMQTHSKASSARLKNTVRYEKSINVFYSCTAYRIIVLQS